MKIVVINLEHRTDRLKFMSEQLKDFQWSRYNAINGHNTSLEQFKAMGFEPFRKWVDPMLGRPHTLTDIAAMASHFLVWSDCAVNNEPVLILEDDARLVGNLNLNEVERLLHHNDIVYLDHKEMFTGQNLDDRFVKPYYPYWNDAYAISPDLAKRIIKSKYKENLIPVDEFYPLINGVNYDKTCLSNNRIIKDNFKQLQELFSELIPIKSIAYKNPVFNQVSRSILGSDIENGPKISEEKMETTETFNMEYTTQNDPIMHIFTVATDSKKIKYLSLSSTFFNISYNNLGEGIEWTGGDMNHPGGGQKINLVKLALDALPENDIVLFVDGYDVFLNETSDTIKKRFIEMRGDIVIATEKTCWPDKSLSQFFTESHTDYKYPNSGLYIGYVSALKKLFDKTIEDKEDDQLYLQKQILKSKLDDANIVLDYENYLFQCLADSFSDVQINKSKQLVNTNTKCCPCIVHANGGEKSIAKLDELITAIVAKPQSTNNYGFLTDGQLEVIAPDILEMNFMTPDACAKLIEVAEANGKWQSMYGDKFPGQEIRVREFSMAFWNALDEHFKNVINPAIEKYWFPLLMYGLRDAFIIKYNPESQSNLKCHHDASLVSGMVKLNDGYTGGETHFYRQNTSNINTKVGKMILWPGQVTHGHEGRTVHTGTKYNLVIWTSRHRGDINY
jgi:GR25 family glycosyltransferase involved in LPS biosynthesis